MMPSPSPIVVEGSSQASLVPMIITMGINVLLVGGFLFLAVYAGWKAFRWLRKWNP